LGASLRKRTLSKVPLRISFGGGGSDVEPFVGTHGGSVVATTINLFVEVSVEEVNQEAVEIHSIDTATSLFFESHLPDEELLENILTACLTRISIDNRRGLRIYVHSPVPSRSGLGGSSAIIVAILAALYVHTGFEFDKWSLALDAFEVERLLLKIPGGCQDQYVCALGGFNYFEFTGYKDAMHVPLNPPISMINRFNESAFLVWTGRSRPTSNVLEDQISRNESGQNTQALEDQKKLAREARIYVENGDLKALATLLSQSWKIKRGFSNLVSNSQIDNIYKIGMENGALGGKLLGAGGGGFFLFISKQNSVVSLKSFFTTRGYEVRGINVVDSGVETSTTYVY
jgi:D-glycero-alpha-D-manno-heptose-7-phosphate kinase